MTTELPRPPGWRRHALRGDVRRSGRPVLADLPVGEGTRRGVLLPVRPAPAWHLALFAVLAVAFAGLSVLSVVAAVRGRPAAALALVLFVPLAGLFAGGAYAAVRSRARRSAGVGLTPEHLVLANFPRPVPVRWDQVRRIGSPSVRWGTAPMPDPVTNAVAVVVHDETLLAHLPGPARRLGVRLLRRTGEVTLATLADTVWDVDPALAYHALRFYLAHPGLRVELGTPAALDRIGRRALAG